VLAILALSVLLVMNLFRRRRSSDEAVPTMVVPGAELSSEQSAAPEGRA
jgi:hypothetical protein